MIVDWDLCFCDPSVAQRLCWPPAKPHTPLFEIVCASIVCRLEKTRRAATREERTRTGSGGT